MGLPTPPRSVPVPPSLAQVAQLVEDRLTEVLDAEVDRWRDLTEDLVAPLDALRRLVMAGGKRLRPAFCYWGFVGAGGTADDPSVVDAGAAFELLQAFALVHDDVMDGSATRRGYRTAHLTFSDRHQAEVWRGEQRRFGEGVAILIGDLAHVYADLLLRDAPATCSRCGTSSASSSTSGSTSTSSAPPGATPTWRPPAASPGTSRASTPSSGRCTSAPPWSAATTSSARSCPRTAIRWARPSSSATTSSAPSASPRSPASRSATTCARASPRRCVAAACALADSGQQAVLDRIGAADGELSDGDVLAIQEVLRDTGALSEIEREIERLALDAIDAIGDADITAPARQALVDLAHFVAWRET